MWKTKTEAFETGVDVIHIIYICSCAKMTVTVLFKTGSVFERFTVDRKKR